MSNTAQRPHPFVTVDVVTIVEISEPKVLLIRRKRPPFEGAWALPGGFVEPGEPLETAARRELLEETGALPEHLEQLHTFGDPGRDPRGWTISVAYLALLQPEDMRDWQLRADSDASQIGWFDLHDPPALAFDHADILTHAVKRLAQKTTDIRAKVD